MFSQFVSLGFLASVFLSSANATPISNSTAQFHNGGMFEIPEYERIYDTPSLAAKDGTAHRLAKRASCLRPN